MLVHPECLHEVVLKADLIGSTEFIIKTIEKAPAGSRWAVGTELNLVKRLALTHPDKEIVFLEKHVYCATMNRIDLPHLVGVGESGCRARRQQIVVDSETEHYAREALQRMLARQARLRRTGFATGRVGDQALVGALSKARISTVESAWQDQVRVAQLIVGHHTVRCCVPGSARRAGRRQLVLILPRRPLCRRRRRASQVANSLLAQFPLPFIQNPHDHQGHLVRRRCCGCSALNVGGVG